MIGDSAYPPHPTVRSARRLIALRITATRHVAVLLALAGSLLCSGQLRAADSSDQSLQEVVVTATRTLPLDRPADIDKVDVPIGDVPRSIEVVPRELFIEQGATQLSEVLRNVSGAGLGGQFAFGFFDRFIIRGLNASFLNDGIPEGTSDLTGLVHSLVGVERVEVLKGPGSALYGGTEEGGTINLVHFRPSDTPSSWVSTQLGSFNTTTTDAAATGPTPISNVDFRIDGEFQHSSGFRGLTHESVEVLPALSWRPDAHDVELRLEYHHLESVPDATGLPFSPPKGTGYPLDVPSEFTYYTPYAFADQQIERAFLSDRWTLADGLRLDNNFSYTNRDVNLARNSGGAVTLLDGDYALARRQLREQQDAFGDFLYQLELSGTAHTGFASHTLLGGFEYRDISGHTSRQTADLPVIPDIYAPVVSDGTFADLNFECNAAHSCDDARLFARFYGLYVLDQIDMGRLKVRLSARANEFTTSGTAQSQVPANPGEEQPCTPAAAAECPWIPGVAVERTDRPLSWDAGAVYFILPALSVFGGASDGTYPIFNTEEPESIGQTPERTREYEGGLRYELRSALTLSTALYNTTRDDVFVVLTDAAGDEVPSTFSYRVKGWEVTVNANPTQRWMVLANYSHEDAVISSYPQTPADVGNRVPGVPSKLANLWTSYDVISNAPFGTLRLSAGLRYRDLMYGDAGNTRLVPGYTLVDFMASLTNRRWSLRGGVNNAFNRQNFLYPAGTGGGAFPGPGTTFLLQASYTIQ